MSRDTFIDSAIARGKSGEQINASLGRLGYDPLNRVEIQQINEGTYGMNLGQRFQKNVKDLTAGASTMIGQGLYTVSHPIKEGLPLLGKAKEYLQGNPSIAGDITNLILSPYNLSLQKAASQSPIESAKDIAAGAYNNPAFALLDTLPVWGGAAGKAAGKIAETLPQSKIKSLLRPLTEEGRNVNQILSQSRATTADTIESLRNQSFKLQQYAPEDLSVAIKNLEAPEMGKWAGNENQLAITKELRDMVKETNSLIVKAGGDPKMLETAAVNQYIVRNLPNDTPLATVERALKDKKFALDNGLEPQKLKELEEEGLRLYKKDLIQPFKHSTEADTVREGLVEESLKKQRSANAKLYGTQSYEDLAKGFIKDGYVPTINKLKTTEGAMTAIRNMADEVGRKVDYTLPELNILKEKPKSISKARLEYVYEAMEDAIESGSLTKKEIAKYLKNGTIKPRKGAFEGERLTTKQKKYFDDWYNVEKWYSRAYHYINEDIKALDDALPNIELKSDEVLVSPKLLNEKFGTSIANGEDILGDIKSLSRGLNKAERAKYADDLYIFNKDDIEALKTAYSPRSSTAGQFGNIAKMGVLATPRYVAGNALTNFLIAPITGTSVRDYLEVIKNSDKLPNMLKRTSSYSGYLGEKLPVNSTMKEVYSQLGKDIAEGSPLRKLEAVNMAVNYPIFRNAQAVESVQRSAEFLNQAKQYAKEVGKTTEQILAEARRHGGNNKTFRIINGRVQHYLGDYLGRNYYSPNWMQSGIEMAAPFYRPLTQGVRQFYNAVKDYPLETQMFYRQPSLAVNRNAQQLREESGTEPLPVYGGYPIKERAGKLAGQVIYSPYHAYSPVGELLLDPIGTLSGNTFAMSPLLPIIGKNRYGDEAKLPNAMKSFDGKLILLDNNGNPIGEQLDTNIPARLRTIAGQYGQQFISPATQANSYILPLLALATGQQYKAPADTSLLGQVGDLRIPFISESNIGARGKSTPEEILLPLMGGTIRNTYKEPTGEVVGKNFKRYGSEMRKRLNRLQWER